MQLTIHTSFLPHTDAEASLGFWRDLLGFELRQDVDYGGRRWLTLGSPDQPDVRVVLEPPAADPGVTEAERATIAEMMAKGTYMRLILATPDLDATYAVLRDAGVEIVQEPTRQPYGVRDCAVRDPAGNLIRIDEVSRED